MSKANVSSGHLLEWFITMSKITLMPCLWHSLINSLRSEGPPISKSGAKKKRVPPFDGDQWNEKKAHIMIDPFYICLMQSAARAASRGVFHGTSSGLNSGNEEAHFLDHLF